MSESHSNEVSVTTNPVELGADITDHAVIEPKKITVVAQVSDTPLGFAAIGQIIDNVTGLFGSSTEQSITRSNAAYNALVQLQETRRPIEVQTKLRLYTNMVITNVKTEQDKNTSRIVRMIINLQEVLIVESEIVQLSEDQLAAGSPEEQGSPADKSGNKEAVPPGEATNTSVIKSITNWIGG